MKAEKNRIASSKNLLQRRLTRDVTLLHSFPMNSKARATSGRVDARLSLYRTELGGAIRAREEILDGVWVLVASMDGKT